MALEGQLIGDVGHARSISATAMALLSVRRSADDHPAAVGPHDVLPRNHVVRADPDARAGRSEPEALEQTPSADHEPRHLHASRAELGAKVVDSA
jgi:hypothetical protein